MEKLPPKKKETTANEAFMASVIAHQIYILRYSKTVRRKIIEVLNASERKIAEAILGKLAGGTGLTTIAHFKKLASVQRTVRGIRDLAWKEANGILQTEMLELAAAEPAFIQSIVTAVLPVQLVTDLPDPRLLRSIALDRPFEGRILKEWAAQMRASDLALITAEIQRGMTQGVDAKQIARNVIGTAAAKGADGITQATRNGVEAVVGTAVQHIANHARREFFNENQDIIDKEQFVATLDERTTVLCMGLDGKIYAFGKGPYPPMHMRCRSLRIVYFDGVNLGNRPLKPTTEAQLLREYAANTRTTVVKGRAQLARGHKEAFDKFARRRVREMIGTVPATVKYPEFLKNQPIWFQDDVLGKTRAALFRTGDITLDKFVDRNGATLTIPQLRKRYSQIFKTAGL